MNKLYDPTADGLSEFINDYAELMHKDPAIVSMLGSVAMAESFRETNGDYHRFMETMLVKAPALHGMLLSIRERRMDTARDNSKLVVSTNFQNSKTTFKFRKKGSSLWSTVELGDCNVDDVVDQVIDLLLKKENTGE